MAKLQDDRRREPLDLDSQIDVASEAYAPPAGRVSVDTLSGGESAASRFALPARSARHAASGRTDQPP
ncbi:MAG: hypothetical protein R3D84_04210 [Paracoccaceae bacterium]